MLIAVNITKFAWNFKKWLTTQLVSRLNKIETQSTVYPSVLLCFNKWKIDTVLHVSKITKNFPGASVHLNTCSCTTTQTTMNVSCEATGRTAIARNQRDCDKSPANQTHKNFKRPLWKWRQLSCETLVVEFCDWSSKKRLKGTPKSRNTPKTRSEVTPKSRRTARTAPNKATHRKQLQTCENLAVENDALTSNQDPSRAHMCCCEATDCCTWYNLHHKARNQSRPSRSGQIKHTEYDHWNSS